MMLAALFCCGMLGAALTGCGDDNSDGDTGGGTPVVAYYTYTLTHPAAKTVTLSDGTVAKGINTDQGAVADLALHFPTEDGTYTTDETHASDGTFTITHKVSHIGSADDVTMYLSLKDNYDTTIEKPKVGSFAKISVTSYDAKGNAIKTDTKTEGKNSTLSNNEALQRQFPYVMGFTISVAKDGEITITSNYKHVSERPF